MLALCKNNPLPILTAANDAIYVAIRESLEKKKDLNRTMDLWRLLDQVAVQRPDSEINWLPRRSAHVTLLALHQHNRLEDARYVTSVIAKVAPGFKRTTEEFLATLLWLGSDRSAPPPRPLYHVRPIPEDAIVIDGKAAEAVYAKNPPLPAPYHLSRPASPGIVEGASTLALTTHVYFSTNAIYLFVRIPEPDSQPRPGGKLRFTMAQNYRRDLRYEYTVSLTPTSTKDLVILQDDAGYSLEARIPLSEIKEGVRNVSGEAYAANVCRVRSFAKKNGAAKKRPQEYISWAPIPSAYHHTMAWNIFLFD